VFSLSSQQTLECSRPPSRRWSLKGRKELWFSRLARLSMDIILLYRWCFSILFSCICNLSLIILIIPPVKVHRVVARTPVPRKKIAHGKSLRFNRIDLPPYPSCDTSRDTSRDTSCDTSHDTSCNTEA
jgi:hypothetical protein